jgi:1,4-alpha-glucan branching enzyme
LYEKAFEGSGFEWVDGGNDNDAILIYNRRGNDVANDLVIVLNMTPVPHHNFRVGVNSKCKWAEIFNSDAKNFWGGGMGNTEAISSETVNWHGREHSINITIPPLGAVIFKKQRDVPPKYELK